MDGSVKVQFTKERFCSVIKHKEVFTLNELGYDPSLHTDVREFIARAWLEWASGYIEGGWAFVNNEEEK